MAFGSMTFRESLRQVVECLNARPRQLYHMGFRTRIARSSLAEANERRDGRIYEAWARGLMVNAHRLYADEPLVVDFPGAAYAFDSSIIDMCLSLHPWAPFPGGKAAIKLNTLLPLRGMIPAFLAVSNANQHDVRALDLLPIEPGSLYVMDRGYLDFPRLYRFHQHGAFFVVQAKDNLRFKRYRSRPNTEGQVRSDRLGRLFRSASRRATPIYCGASATSTSKSNAGWFFRPTTGCRAPQPWPKCTGADGASNGSSGGSNCIYVFADFTEPRRMP